MRLTERYTARFLALIAAILLLNALALILLYHAEPAFCTDDFWYCIYRNFICIGSWHAFSWQYAMFIVLACLDYLLLIFLLFFNAYTIAKKFRSHMKRKNT